MAMCTHQQRDPKETLSLAGKRILKLDVSGIEVILYTRSRSTRRSAAHQRHTSTST